MRPSQEPANDLYLMATVRRLKAALAPSVLPVRVPDETIAAEVIRMLESDGLANLLSHCRPGYFYDVLQQAKLALTRFYTAMRFLPQETPRATNTMFEEKFIAAMDDDFNTPVALSVLFDLAHEIQRLREKDMQAAAAHGALLKYLGGVLGVLQTDTEIFFQSRSKVDAAKIESLIAARELARKEKNWAEADRIRGELTKMNIVIEDGAGGTTWKSQ